MRRIALTLGTTALLATGTLGGAPAAYAAVAVPAGGGCTLALTGSEQTVSCTYTATTNGQYVIAVQDPWEITTGDPANQTTLVSGDQPSAGRLVTIPGEDVTVTVYGSPQMGPVGAVSVGDQPSGS